jgi:hypothetical protein
MTRNYEIQTRNSTNPNWNVEGVGDNNRFDSEHAAEKAIESLRALGPDWAAAEYRVREIKG